ncbi:M14 family metallopeptidase [Thalassotalea agariperforans]
MQISANFDSGNITVIKANQPENIELAINNDHNSEFFQWFHFKLHNNQHVPHVINLVNAGQSAYLQGWPDYQAVASYDRQYWFRVPTSFDGQTLTINFTPEFDTTYFAYFAPYSYERHQDLIHTAQLNEQCQLQVLGQTVDGRDISLLKIGEDDKNKPVIWLTARQHPGETMAQWFIEGLLERLFDEDDGIARSLLNKAVFYIVPNMNPDGSVRGHLRTNAVGINLNREWQTPSLENSPEVFFVREKMLATGVDMFLDIHGDEAIPYNFLAGCEGVPSYSEKQQQLGQKFKAMLLAVTPEFQVEHGYPVNPPGQANLTIAANWVGEHFSCLSYTIEMPFKDNFLLPDPQVGWSDERSRIFGKDVLTAIHHVVADLT